MSTLEDGSCGFEEPWKMSGHLTLHIWQAVLVLYLCYHISCNLQNLLQVKKPIEAKGGSKCSAFNINSLYTWTDDVNQAIQLCQKLCIYQT